MSINVGLLGLGTVGVGTAKILLDPVSRHPLVSQLTLTRVGVRSLDKPRGVDLPRHCFTTDLDSIVTDPSIAVVVEVLGGVEPARSLILRAIAHGKHVVTANKAVIARHGDEIFTAANQAGVYVLLEAAVGGGIPVIQPLKQALGVNRIDAVTGIINGTTNYILTRMQREGGDFEAILAEAQRLGYAEATPLPISMVWMRRTRLPFWHPSPLPGGLSWPMSTRRGFARSPLPIWPMLNG